MTPARGEVWLLDLGLAEKVRPALVISAPFGDADSALVTVHTTSLRDPNLRFQSSSHSLKAGAFEAQGVSTYPHIRAIRKLGVLKSDQFRSVFDGVLRWLGQGG
jgi:mRNA interferase MazF